MSTDKLQDLHEAFADAFSECRLTSTQTELLPPAFDHGALSEMFGESHQTSADKELSHLASDREALSQIMGERNLISTSTELSSSIFDNADLAKLFGEPLPRSTDTNPSPTRFDHQARAEILSEPAAVPIDPQPEPLSFDKGSSSEPQPENEEPVTRAVEVQSSTSVEGARKQRARSLLTKLHHIFSNKAEPPPSDIEGNPSSPSLSDQPRTPELVANAVTPASLAEAEHELPHQPTPLRTELRSPTLGRSAREVAPPADPESARLQQPRSLLVEPVSSPSPLMFGKEPSRPVFFRRQTHVDPAEKADNPELAAEIVAVASPANTEGAQSQHVAPLLVELPTPISIDVKSSPASFRPQPSLLTLSGQFDNVGPSAITVAALPENPPFPIFEKDRQVPGSTIGNSEGAVMGPRGENPPLSEVQSMSSTLPSRTFENERSFLSFTGQPDQAEPAARFVAASAPTEPESAVTRAQQAKSLLATLDLYTAIRLRWVMRDIRSKRTKLSPVGDNDLTTLLDLGLVEMQDDIPGLTALGVLALD